MRVLFTNHALDRRAGSELYVRDVATRLLEIGHEPVVYSRVLGDVAAEIRRASIPVVDDLDRLGAPPDVIHGQHHLETMTALARFPDTPAVYVCHGWLPPEEAPPRHPRIRRWVAVDHLVHSRLVDECGIPAEDVEIHLNFVDLRRFTTRPPLPARAGRALVFSNYVDDEILSTLREACTAEGIALDTMGLATGTQSNRPEDSLGTYDIVFAKGRAALEAAATGTAVIVCDRSGLGPMVRLEDLPRIRRLNFGVRLLRRRHDPDTVVERLRSYDAEDAGRVTRQIRAEAGLDVAVERLVDLYERACREPVDPDPPAEAEALHAYLRWGPLTGGEIGEPERQLLLLENRTRERTIAELRERLAELDRHHTDLHHLLERHGEDAERVRQRDVAELHQRLEELGHRHEDLHRRLLEQTRESAEHASAAQEAARREEDLRHRLADTERGRDDLATICRRLEADLTGLRNELETARTELGGARRAESEQASLLADREARLEGLRNELAWMRGSASWRLRERLLGLPGVRRMVRALRGKRPDEASPPGSDRVSPS